MITKKMTGAYKTVERVAVDSYQKIENAVVGCYQKIETGAVEGFAKVTDKCVEVLFAREGETVAEARKRLASRGDI